MRQCGGGTIADGIIDEYPLPQPIITVNLTALEVKRLLGITISIAEIASILRRLQFETRLLDENTLQVTVPPHRLDISEDAVVGQADLVEEVARVYGYDRLPSTMMADAMPEQWANHELLWEEKARDLLVNYGLRENIGYRFTTPEQESLLSGTEGLTLFSRSEYVHITNPIAADKTVLRRSLLGGMLSQLLQNKRWRDTHQVFEIGPVFRALPDDHLPEEETILAILLSGFRQRNPWLGESNDTLLDFYDLKGLIHGLLEDLHVTGWEERRSTHPTYHPGRAVDIWLSGNPVISYGELHPLVARNYDLAEEKILVGELKLNAIQNAAKTNFSVQALPTTPPVFQDIALIVSRQTSHEDLARVIRRAGGKNLREIRCFDVYTGPPIPKNKKSLAFKLTYRADGRTMTDKEVAKIHQRIVRAAEREWGAKLRT